MGVVIMHVTHVKGIAASSLVDDAYYHILLLLYALEGSDML